MLTVEKVNEVHNFDSKGGFFREISGSVTVQKEHYIGVSTSGNKDSVFIQYLTCQVKIVDPLPYYTQVFGSSEPKAVLNWRVMYHNWSRGKGTWGSRRNYQDLDSDYVDTILGKEARCRLEEELLSDMGQHLREGLTALGKFVEARNGNYDNENNCKQCGEHFYEAHQPHCSLSDAYNKDI